MTQALRESSNNVRALALSLLPLVLVAHGGADAGELSAVDALRQFAEPLSALGTRGAARGAAGARRRRRARWRAPR
jgi:hypothetical protein